MKERRISISPYSLISLMELNIHKKVSQHSTARIVGLISEEIEDKYVEMAGENEWITIEAIDDDKSKILFKGIVQTVSVRNENQVRIIEILAVSGSYLMDLSEKTRTFQDEKQTYKSIMNSVKNGYEKAGVYMTIGENQSTGSIIVQYRETDWNFIKRLASHFNSYIVPEDILEGAKIYFGRPNRDEIVTFNPISYSMKKDVAEYMEKIKNKVSGIGENDSIYYCVESREIYELCAPVKFLNRKLYIYEINSKLEGSVIRHFYTLKSERGFKSIKQYNKKIIGASLDATVLAVSKDTVKLHLAVDSKQDESGAKWFPYSTVYSSPDGTGWYCMPEKGDKVRLYFPDEKEKNAFAISSVHLEGSNQDKRSNPDIKVLSTKYGKQIIFYPDAIEIKNHDDLYIKLYDDGGIIINSDKNISINSKEDISIVSDEKIQMVAKEGLEFKQGETSLEINENVVLKGGQVKME